MIRNNNCCDEPRGMDGGGKPMTVDIACATERNKNYRTALWTGDYLQATLMCIPAGGDVGLEVHCDADQVLFIVSGCGLAVMGPCRRQLCFRRKVESGCAVFVPAGTWHNLINTGCEPLKLYSLYAPPQHPFGTVERTKEDAECEE